MIFTIGYKPNYDDGIVKHGDDFKKMGARDDFKGQPYPGGSVWESAAEAEAYLAANQPRLEPYAVYGVIASWEADTTQVEGEPFRRLMKDSMIVSVSERTAS